MSAKGNDPRYPHRMTFSANALQLLAQSQAAQDTLDLIQGRQLRMSLQDAGPFGRVVVQQFQDEVLFTVEHKA